VFGIYRYGLAFCVAISHLWGGMIGGPAAYAVWGFYCLSGYLMTLILNEKYGFSPRGLGRFAVNRALRIYPAYYVACAGMFLLYYFKPGTAARFLPQLQMPSTAQGWRFSLFLMTGQDGGQLLQGSSALRVELWFYVAMALGLARNRWITGAWFTASVGYTVWLLAVGTPFAERYVFIPACSLAFSFGSLICHIRDRLPVIHTPWAAVSAAAIWWLHVWVTQNIPGGPWIFGLYSSLIFAAFAMVTLMRLDAETMAWCRPDRPPAGPRLRDGCPPLTPRLPPIAARLKRSTSLPKWSLVVSPEPRYVISCQPPEQRPQGDEEADVGRHAAVVAVHGAEYGHEVIGGAQDGPDDPEGAELQVRLLCRRPGLPENDRKAFGDSGDEHPVGGNEDDLKVRTAQPIRGDGRRDERDQDHRPEQGCRDLSTPQFRPGVDEIPYSFTRIR
jgi:hypothetical protein